MRDWSGKRYWMVGASEGLGLALARLVSGAGAEVILSARHEPRLSEAMAVMPGRATILPCDVTDAASVSAAAAAAGQVDGVVVTAGAYWPMRAQDWDAARVIEMAEVNLTGTLRVVGEVLPGMVARDAGHVVLTGALAGYRGRPGSIGQAATKAAVMALAEAMHADLRATGVTVQLACPGPIRTRLSERNDFAMPFRMEAEAAAQEMFELMCTDQFRKAFPLLPSWLVRAGQMLPDWAWFGTAGR